MNSSVLDRLTRYGLIGVVAAAPVVFGGARDWISSPLAAAIGVLAILRSLVTWRDGDASYVDPRWLAIPALGMMGAFAWMALQILGWTPESWSNGLYRAAAEILGGSVRARIAIEPDLAVAAAMRLLGCVGVFWLALSICRDARRAGQLQLVIVLVATAMALYGLLNHQLTESQWILWRRNLSEHLRLSGTFVNPDNFATYAGLALLVALARFGRAGGIALGRNEDPWRARVRRAGEYTLGSGIGWVMAILLLTAALLLSASRAGISATALAIVALAITARHMRSGSLIRRATITLLVVLGVGGVLLLSGGQFVWRLFFLGQGIDFRLGAYELALKAAAVAPWFGWGGGSFVWVYPQFQPAGGAWPDSLLDLVHSTPLEAVVEFGLPAALVIHLSLAWTFFLCVSGAIARQRDMIHPRLAVAATVLVAVHGLVDFPLQIPGIAMIYAAVLGAGVAQSWSSRKDSKRGDQSASVEGEVAD